MKKTFILLSMLAVFFTMSATVFAGDVPEALSYEDNAKVFIGTLKDFEQHNSSSPKIQNVSVIPTFKIKGDVLINELQTYELCYFGKVTPKKETEYLFGWLADNSVWVYEIESYNENEIKLHITDAFAERIQNYLDEGLYAMQEKERSTLGEEISLLEFLYKNPLNENSDIKTIRFRYQDKSYEVDKDEFFKTAEEIMITNVKNDALKESGVESSIDAYKTILFIDLLDSSDKTQYFAAVSRFGEVDKYSLFMSRLMAKDYEMKPKDIKKLYSLLPDEVPLDVLSETSAVPKENFAGIFVTMTLAVIIIAFIIGIIIYKKKKN